MEEKSVKNFPFISDKKSQPDAVNGKSSKLHKKQARQFENIFDDHPEAMIITDREGHIEHMNRAAISMLGEPTPGMEFADWPDHFGFSLDEGLIPFSAEQFISLIAQNGETEKTLEILIKRDGDAKDRWVSISAKPILNSKGQTDGTSFLLQDITTRKLMELSRETYIQRTETLYRLSHIISESGNDAKRITQAVTILLAEVIGDLASLSLLSPDGQKISISAFYDSNAISRNLFRKVLNAWGTEFPADQGASGEVIQSGKPLLRPFIPPEEMAAVTLPEFKEFVKEVGISSSLTVPMIGRGGIVGVISLGRHRDRKPYTPGDQSFLLDIAYRTALALENGFLVESLRNQVTERISVERALNVSEERFRSIFESTTLGIKLLDLGGNILGTNRSFQEMLGYTEKEMLGRHFYDFIHTEDTSRAIRLFHDLKISGLPDFRFEHRALKKDGSPLWVKTTFTGVKRSSEDNSLAFIVGIVENINEQKRLQSVMAEMNSRLQTGMELERLRLAQELHDGPMQDLYNAIYRIEELRTKNGIGERSELESLSTDIKNVLGNLRATAKALRPPTISSFGLEKAIRSNAEDFREKHPDIKLQLSLAQDGQILPEETRLALFRIVQQSLGNIARHADASEVQIRFTLDAE
ncbi:MAG TPA: PAS domain S-box protein, partial [Anaerolineales bacterium]